VTDWLGQIDIFVLPSAAALAGALQRAILHPYFRRRMADAGSDFVRTNFSRETGPRRR
jgi:hypothetical protein